MVEDKTIREFIGAIKEEPEIPSTTQTGVVSRIDEEGTVWVYLSGSDRETPTAANASEVKRGDAVNVEWRNNRLYISGNYTDPSAGSERVRAIQDSALQAADAAGRALVAADSAEASAAIAKQTTDEINAYAETAGKTVTQILNDGETAGTAAQEAKDAAQAAQNSLKSVVQGATTVEKAVSVMQTALEAVVDYDPQNDTTTEYFWHDANGAHVLGTSGDYRNDITSEGMEIVDTSTEDAVARFGVSGAQVGKDESARLNINPDALSAYNEDSVCFFDVDYSGSTVTDYSSSPIRNRKISAQLKTSETSYSIYNLDTSNVPNGVVLSPLSQISIRVEPISDTIAFDANVSPSTTNCTASSYYPRIMIIDVPVGNITAGTDYSFNAQVIATHVNSLGTLTLEITAEYVAAENRVTITLKTQESTNDNMYARIGISGGGFSWQVTTRAPALQFGTQTGNKGDFSQTLGEGLTAESANQTVIGKYNDNDAGNIFEIGNGSSSSPSNALTVDWSGNVEAAGDIEDGSGNVLSELRKVQNTYGVLTTLSSSLSLTTSAQKVPLNTFTGNNCSKSSNGIKVTDAGVYEVSGSAYFQSGFTANDLAHLQIRVGSTTAIESVKRLSNASPYEIVVVPATIVTLNANDVIYLYAYNQSGARGTVASYTGNGLVLKRIA